MNAQVDVLGAIDALVWIADQEGQESEADAGRQARADVAALIAEREQRAREYQHVLDMLGVATHEEAGAEIGRLHAAALRQQPAPVGLEQFRAAICSWRQDATKRYAETDDYAGRTIMVERVAEANRLLALIDNAGKVEIHPDDAAVDRFAVAMKAKLADARAKGRGGWQGDEPGMQQRLSDMLRTHVEKGDPRDVANFAMFLHQRYESILPAHQPAPVLDDELPGMWSQSDFMGGATDAADNAHRPVPAVDEALRVDAERYRWLRKPTSDVGLVIDKVTGEVPYHEGTHTGGYATYEYRAGDELDSAIDAALARAQGVQS